jgi:hypothetical protein
MVCHRSRVILDILFVIELDRSMTKIDCHRTALACVAGAATLAGASVENAFHVYML